MELLTPADWTDYELIDTGNREKLERFGKYILIRPEPQAVWKKAMTEEEWEKMAHARFLRGKPASPQSAVTNLQSPIDKKKSPSHHLTISPSHHGTTAPPHHGTAVPRKEERGEWIRKPEMPDQWMIGYQYKEMQLKFRLGLTAFGHIGVFPEQAENWKYVYDSVRRTSGQADERTSGQADERTSGMELNPESHIAYPGSLIKDPSSGIRILNLFAYTGGASLAAKAAGADVVHVDSVKQVINWAREDMENSGLDGIRWVVEDALKFVRREVKRGNRYDGIILDPPAYGRGPEGEKWILEDSIDEMISLCTELLRGQGTGHRAQGTEHRAQDLIRGPQSGDSGVQSSLVPRPSSFIILSLYSMGFSSLIGESLLRSHFGKETEIRTGEFYFNDRAGRKLPLGTYTRFFQQD